MLCVREQNESEVITMQQSDERYSSMFRRYPDVVDVKMIQVMLGGVSRHKIYELFKEQKISYFRLSRKWMARKMAVIDYIMKQEKPSNP